MNLTEDQQDTVIGALCEGLGVEDISVRFGLRLADVRAFVFALPRDLLREIYGRGGDSIS